MENSSKCKTINFYFKWTDFVQVFRVNHSRQSIHMRIYMISLHLFQDVLAFDISMITINKWGGWTNTKLHTVSIERTLCYLDIVRRLCWMNSCISSGMLFGSYELNHLRSQIWFKFMVYRLVYKWIRMWLLCLINSNNMILLLLRLPLVLALLLRPQIGTLLPLLLPESLFSLHITYSSKNVFSDLQERRMTP